MIKLKKLACMMLAIVVLLTSSSCIDIIEEMTLNKDGSGKFSMRMDMGEMMSMMKMFSSMEGAMEGLGEEGEGLDGSLKELMSGEAQDVTIKPNEEQAKAFADNPGFADKINVRTQIAPSKNKFQLDFNLDFADLDDVDYFFKNLDKIMSIMSDEEGESSGDMLGMGGNPMVEIMGKSDNVTRYYDLTKRTLIRRADPPSEESAELEGEEAEMMKMMMGDATYTTIIHFPGKVKKMTNAEATLSADRKTVTTEGKLLDQMEGNLNVANIIKFCK